MTITDLVYIDSTGYHYSDYPSFLSWLTSQYQTIYGSDVYLGPDSQDGQFLAILAQAFYDTAALGASVYNSFSPTTAQGVGLSRVVKINGISRQVSSYSTVTLTIIGSEGTNIVNGIAGDILGQQWLLPVLVTIPFGGTINVVATAAIIGQVFGDTATITTIVTPTLGWQSVNNSAPATPGQGVEADSTLRLRQVQSTSIPAQTVFDATLGAVGNIPGVEMVYGYENYTNTTDVNNLPAHSICVTVVAGPPATDQEIANTITDYKTPGTDPVGNTGPIVTYDSQGMPVNIYFSHAIPASIQVQVSLTRLPGWSNDFQQLIANAIAAQINAFKIGNADMEILYTIFFATAYISGTAGAGTFSITDINIGINGGGVSHTAILLDQGLQGSGAQVATCDPGTLPGSPVDVTLIIT